MPGDDVEKLSSALDTLERRLWPSKKRRGRKTLVVRLLLAVLALWVCYALVVRRTAGYTAAAPSSIEKTTAPGPAPAAPAPAAAAPGGVATTPKLQPLAADEDQSSPKSRVPLESTPPKDTDEVVVKNDRTDLLDSLKQLVLLLPDEIHVENLLRPIESTGELRLRELGLRTRNFKTLFDAWEKVHLVPDSEDRDALFIRDDVIQYARRHPHLASSLNMDTTQLIHVYETYRSIITQLSTLLFPWTAPYFPDHTHLHAQIYRGGRGLVFSAGDNQARFLLTSIPTIRELGCHLPIEIMYLGDRDLSEDIREQLEALPGVTTRDLSQMVNDSGWTLAGWAGKPFAIVFSSFREVIFIDADSLFFQNPELLFDDEAYLATGALFFKDRLFMPELKKKWLQEVLPKPISTKAMESRLWTGQSGHMQESGVVVVDKWRHFIALLLITRMNGPDRDGNKEKNIVGVYDMVYGDKETFWLGWELVGDLDYAFHDGDAGIMGIPEKPKTSSAKDTPTSPPPDYTICAPQLLHLDRHGRPLWFNGWLLPNKFDNEKNREPGKFEAYLREPREIQEPGAWQLRESNVCCLTAREKLEFSAKEKETLAMMVDAGRRVGAFGKKQ